MLKHGPLPIRIRSSQLDDRLDGHYFLFLLLTDLPDPIVKLSRNSIKIFEQSIFVVLGNVLRLDLTSNILPNLTDRDSSVLQPLTQKLLHLQSTLLGHRRDDD